MELKKSEFISLSVDESLDISEADNLVLVIRYFTSNSVVERFINLFQLDEKTGNAIFNAVKDFLKKENLDSKVVAISTDGGGSMIGKEKGFASRMKNYKPGIIFTHCIAHKTALSIKDLVEIMPELSYLNSIHNSLISFLSDSSLELKNLKTLFLMKTIYDYSNQ